MNDKILSFEEYIILSLMIFHQNIELTRWQQFLVRQIIYQENRR